MNRFTEEIPGDKKTLIYIIESVGILLILICAISIGYGLDYMGKSLRNGYGVEKLDDYSSYELPTEVYDIHGEKITEFIIFKRQIIPFHKIPENLIYALIAMEDKRFYKHNGFDLYAMGRALVKNIRNWKVVEGGSTVTQQLAKLVFTKGEKSYSRKIDELLLSLQIEKRYSKNEILEKYFNRIYFNHSVYGVEMASQYFYGKPVDNLSIAEAAMLVAIPRAPGRYSPFKNPIAAQERQKLVLSKVVEEGYVSKEEANSSFQNFWKQINERMISKNPRSAIVDRIDKAPYFSEYVRQYVENNFKEKLYEIEAKKIKEENPDLSDQNLERKVDKKVREYLFTGGFQIYTTLDLKKQEIAKQELSKQLKIQDKIYASQTKGTYNKLVKNYTDTFNFIGLSRLQPGYHFRYKQELKDVRNKLKQEVESIQFVAGIFGIDSINRLYQKYQEELEDENLSLKVEGALVSIEPSTGHIVAMVGGRKFSKRNQLNRALSKRQPGSSFKAFVYGAAFQSRIFSPASVLDDEPLSYYDRKTGLRWSPGNAGGRYRGAVSLRNALKFSINTIAVQIVRKIGPQNVIKFAAPMMNIEEERFRNDMSIALGTTELSPLEMCTGIAVYSNRGKKVTPTAILRITDRNGNLIDLKDYIPKQIDNIILEKDILDDKKKDFLLSIYQKAKNNKVYILKKRLTTQERIKISTIFKTIQYIPKQIEMINFENKVLNKVLDNKKKDFLLSLYQKAYNNKFYILKELLTAEERTKLSSVLKEVQYKKGLFLEQLDKEKSRESQYVISPQLAYLMTNLLNGVVTGGTAAGAMNRAGFRRPAAGKTGTTQDNKDVWFVGYTPQLATAVWVGFDKASISLGRRQYGGTVAAPVWAKFMKRAHQGLPVRRFYNPGGLRGGVVCKVTGLAQGKACLAAAHGGVRDIFLPGSFPRKVCSGHGVTKGEEDFFKGLDKDLEGEKTVAPEGVIKLPETGDPKKEKKDATGEKKPEKDSILNPKIKKEDKIFINSAITKHSKKELDNIQFPDKKENNGFVNIGKTVVINTLDPKKGQDKKNQPDKKSNDPKKEANNPLDKKKRKLKN